MTADEIISDLARVYLDDLHAPFLWSDDFLLAALNRGQQEAAVRTLCLYDETTPEVCEVTLIEGQTRYPLDPRIIRVESAYFDYRLLEQVDPVDMDRLYPGAWRPEAGAPISWYANDSRVLALTAPPTDLETGQILGLGVYRLPLEDMQTGMDVPEIPSWMHRVLAHWACFEAFSVVDADNARPDLAGYHNQQFESYFGPAVPVQVQTNKRRTPRPVRTVAAPYDTGLVEVQKADWRAGGMGMKRGKPRG